MELLLKAQADPNLQDKYGWTALQLAAEKGHLELVKTLVEAKANPKLTDNQQRTAIDLATKSNKLDI